MRRFAPIGRLAPIGKIAPGCDKKHNLEPFKNAIAPVANLRMITVYANNGISSKSSSDG